MVTRGGDVNDVIDITTTITGILEYIDGGSGDYLASVWNGNPTPASSGNLFTGADLDGPFMIPPYPEDFDDTKIGWTESGESDYAKINTENSTIEIKRSGSYSVFLAIFWTTEATEGGVVAGVSRSDVQTSMNTSGLYALHADILGDPFQKAIGVPGITGWIGPNFYQEGAVITPLLFPTEDVEVTLVLMAIERI